MVIKVPRIVDINILSALGCSFSLSKKEDRNGKDVGDARDKIHELVNPQNKGCSEKAKMKNNPQYIRQQTYYNRASETKPKQHQDINQAAKFQL